MELFFKGQTEIDNFKELRIEIKLPEYCDYCNNVEYEIIKDLHYIVKYIPNGWILVDSNSNPYGKMCGVSLYMYDEIENKKHIFIENNIVYFYPYQIYKSCLDYFINKEGINLNDIEVYFKLEIDTNIENISCHLPDNEDNP